MIVRPKRTFSGAVAVLVIVLATIGSVYAAYIGAHGGQRHVPLPITSSATGKRCVQPTAVMRRDHMAFLLHQRFITVHQGHSPYPIQSDSLCQLSCKSGDAQRARI